MAASADFPENTHHVKLDPFFKDLSSFDEGNVNGCVHLNRTERVSERLI